MPPAAVCPPALGVPMWPHSQQQVHVTSGLCQNPDIFCWNCGIAAVEMWLLECCSVAQGLFPHRNCLRLSPASYLPLKPESKSVHRNWVVCLSFISSSPIFTQKSIFHTCCVSAQNTILEEMVNLSLWLRGSGTFSHLSVWEADRLLC